MKTLGNPKNNHSKSGNTSTASVAKKEIYLKAERSPRGLSSPKYARSDYVNTDCNNSRGSIMTATAGPLGKAGHGEAMHQADIFDKLDTCLKNQLSLSEVLTNLVKISSGYFETLANEQQQEEEEYSQSSTSMGQLEDQQQELNSPGAKLVNNKTGALSNTMFEIATKSVVSEMKKLFEQSRLINDSVKEAMHGVIEINSIKDLMSTEVVPPTGAAGGTTMIDDNNGGGGGGTRVSSERPSFKFGAGPDDYNNNNTEAAETGKAENKQYNNHTKIIKNNTELYNNNGGNTNNNHSTGGMLESPKKLLVSLNKIENKKVDESTATLSFHDASILHYDKSKSANNNIAGVNQSGSIPNGTAAFLSHRAGQVTDSAEFMNLASPTVNTHREQSKDFNPETKIPSFCEPEGIDPEDSTPLFTLGGSSPKNSYTAPNFANPSMKMKTEPADMERDGLKPHRSPTDQTTAENLSGDIDTDFRRFLKATGEQDIPSSNAENNKLSKLSATMGTVSATGSTAEKLQNSQNTGGGVKKISSNPISTHPHSSRNESGTSESINSSRVSEEQQQQTHNRINSKSDSKTLHVPGRKQSGSNISTTSTSEAAPTTYSNPNPNASVKQPTQQLMQKTNVASAISLAESEVGLTKESSETSEKMVGNKFASPREEQSKRLSEGTETLLKEVEAEIKNSFKINLEHNSSDEEDGVTNDSKLSFECPDFGDIKDANSPLAEKNNNILNSDVKTLMDKMNDLNTDLNTGGTGESNPVVVNFGKMELLELSGKKQFNDSTPSKLGHEGLEQSSLSLAGLLRVSNISPIQRTTSRNEFLGESEDGRNFDQSTNDAAAAGGSNAANNPNINKEKEMITKMIQEDEEELRKAIQGETNPGFGFERCMISALWLNKWKNHVNFNGEDTGGKDSDANVGIISNRDLMIAVNTEEEPENLNFELRKDLVEFTDFEIVSKKVFDVLQQWYGCDYIISSMFMPQPPQQPLVPQGTKLDFNV